MQKKKWKATNEEKKNKLRYGTSQVSSVVIYPGGKSDLSLWNSSKVDQEEEEEEEEGGRRKKKLK